MLCDRCEHAEYHGLSRDPKKACTVYLWCPTKGDHGTRTLCTDFMRGEPKKVFDDAD